MDVRSYQGETYNGVRSLTMKNITWLQPVIIDELRFHSAWDTENFGENISEQGCFAQRDVTSFDSNF